MKFASRNLKRTIEKMKQIMKDVKKKVKIFSIGDIFKDQNGNIFAYIKEIKEINDLAIVRLRGTIDSYTIPIIRANLGSKLEKYLDKDILLDFKEVAHIDSATLASFIQLLNELKMYNRKLGIANAPLLLKSYLNITKLESVVQIYKSEKAALEDLLQN